MITFFSALVDTNPLPNVPAEQTSIANILSIVFTVAGAVAVLIITLAGFKYVMSQGDPQKTARAKDTILYAVIGLVVMIFANVIVTFVVTKL